MNTSGVKSLQKASEVLDIELHWPRITEHHVVDAPLQENMDILGRAESLLFQVVPSVLI